MSRRFRVVVASSNRSNSRRSLYRWTLSGSTMLSSTPSGMFLSVGLRLRRFASSFACACACCCCAICAWDNGAEGWGPEDIMGPATRSASAWVACSFRFTRFVASEGWGSGPTYTTAPLILRMRRSLRHLLLREVAILRLHCKGFRVVGTRRRGLVGSVSKPTGERITLERSRACFLSEVLPGRRGRSGRCKIAALRMVT